MTYPIIGITRIRNESLIIQDTLDHIAQFVDGIIVYDDASTDNTVEIVNNHPKVIQVIQNPQWQPEREVEESRHRQILLKAAQPFNPQWLFYFDADERFEGDIREFLLENQASNIAGIRIRLFDAYITKADQLPYKSGPLLNFRKYFGQEKREILMIFKNLPTTSFQGLDAREPHLKGKVITKFYCQHYGKSISIKHWEDTCQYYIKNFPAYAAKWQQRQGKAIHTQSDFDRKLYNWHEVKKNSVLIYQYHQPEPVSLLHKLKRKLINRIP